MTQKTVELLNALTVVTQAAQLALMNAQDHQTVRLAVEKLKAAIQSKDDQEVSEDNSRV